MFHVANAWEESDEEVVVQGCRTEDMDLMGIKLMEPPKFYEWRFNFSTGGVVERVIDADTGVEFPVVNPRLVGRKTRYTFCVQLERKDSVNDWGFVGCVKYDNQTGKSKRFQLPKGCHAGEFVFVPRQDRDPKVDVFFFFLPCCAHC